MTPAELLKLGFMVSIVLAVLGLGLTTSWNDVTYLLRKPGLLARSLLSMYVIMPFICACAALIFRLPPTVKVALMALAISPMPPFLPKKEIMAAGGRAAYAVGLLSLCAVLSIVYVPLVTSLFRGWFESAGGIPAASVAKIVFVTILIPLLVGMTLRATAPALAEKAAKPAGVAAMGFLLVCSVFLLLKEWPVIRSFIGDGTLLILALIALVATAVGHFLGGPHPWERTVLGLSTSARHPGVAITIATFGVPEGRLALGAVLLYVFVVTTVTVPYVIWCMRRARLAGAVA
jgi:BASS family bile acid:Na+ symporter